MTPEARAERTANLLVARLDALARTASQLPHADTERLVELASVATIHAVALDLLHAEHAREIWAAAHERHPGLPAVTLELPASLAA